MTRASKRARKNAEFVLITTNTGDRPVRAIVNNHTTQRVFGRIDYQGVLKYLESDVGEQWNFGQERKDAINRLRKSLTVGQVQHIFRHYTDDQKTLNEVEHNIKTILLKSHEDGGVLYTHTNAVDGKKYVYNRNYTNDNYRIVFAGIFEDPINSSAQNNHVDVHADRDPIWNIVVPLQLKYAAEIARSQFCTSRCSQQRSKLEEATMWDAGWTHRGLGNNTGETRIMLHLVIAPTWMVASDTYGGQWNLYKKDVFMESESKYAAGQSIRRIQYGKLKKKQDNNHGTISTEYNNGKRLHKFGTPMYSWIRRILELDY